MTIASTRAQAVATILWELKRAEKLSTLSAIADRAGFSPGPSCRTISTCLKTVRRDWPHLEWWRAVGDKGQLEETQGEFLRRAGFGVRTESDGTAMVASLAEELMSWAAPEEAAPVAIDA